jgi:hypothetical protein
MTVYKLPSGNQPQAHFDPELLGTDARRLMLAVRLRVLQMQLRHGRDVHAADITRLTRYCVDARAPEARS